MKRDWFLLALLALVGVLSAAGVGIFALRQDITPYGPEDTPEGVLRNYILAVQNHDLDRAYGYLAEETRPDRETFDAWCKTVRFPAVKISMNNKHYTLTHVQYEELTPDSFIKSPIQLTANVELIHYGDSIYYWKITQFSLSSYTGEN